ncbi:Smr/MutS family protein [Oryzifoliimicrobium ureilyticus]|uniref:Smr/MutS family protein n=1 Tax=Oryzifoliimicrobium ureilyticus TaxID=3113724 RepID=UPI00307671DE
MSKDRKLSSEERILWGKVARSARPLHPERMSDDDVEAFEQEATHAMASGRSHLTPAQAEPDRPVKKKPSGIHYPLERPVKKKIAKGRVALEARLDLHGLVQDEAHAVLLDFLIRAHQRGLRHVLVITGKGSSYGSDGALKRAVPLWFSKPDFRHLISSYETAARHHGGEGALYIRLARRHGEEA